MHVGVGHMRCNSEKDASVSRWHCSAASEKILTFTQNMHSKCGRNFWQILMIFCLLSQQAVIFTFGSNSSLITTSMYVQVKKKRKKHPERMGKVPRCFTSSYSAADEEDTSCTWE